MGDRTKIEWADASINVSYGCSPLSPGCKNCYAKREMARLAGKWPEKYGHLVTYSQGGCRWSNEILVLPERLVQALRWQRPRRIFVNSMSDLFHEKMPSDYIAAVFAMMGAAKQHQFQVLTKRADRMWQWFQNLYDQYRDPYQILEHCETAAAQYGLDVNMGGQWPVQNVWIGVSVEDAPRMVRMDYLRGTPGAVRFLSCEPLLGDLGKLDLTGIHWVIVGGESGPGARQMHSEWVRSIRDQCLDAEVAFFMKQLGGPVGKKRSKMEDFPSDLRIRDEPDVAV